MKKIIYLNKLEVNLGDQIEIGGMLIKVTQELIDANPNKFEISEIFPEYCKNDGYFKSIPKEIFKVNLENGNVIGTNFSYCHVQFAPSTKEEFDKQELLKEAKKRYPIGTKFIDASEPSSTRIQTATSDPYFYFLPEEYISVALNGGVIYYNGKWAEIIPQKQPLFKDELENDVYRGDGLRVVNKYDFGVAILNLQEWRPTKDTVCFLKKEDADHYIKMNKPLFKTEDGYDIKYGNSVYWVATENCENYIEFDYGLTLAMLHPKLEGYKYFKIKENAEKYILSKLYKE